MGFNRAEPRKLDPANHPCAAAPLTRPWQGVDPLGTPLPSGTVVMEPMAIAATRGYGTKVIYDVYDVYFTKVRWFQRP